LNGGIEGMSKKRSTFFPHEWSRETVQKKIVEAFKYAKKNHISPIFQPETENFLLSGFTNDGIAITMIINSEGKIITAFPKW